MLLIMACRNGAGALCRPRFPLMNSGIPGTNNDTPPNQLYCYVGQNSAQFGGRYIFIVSDANFSIMRCETSKAMNTEIARHITPITFRLFVSDMSFAYVSGEFVGTRNAVLNTPLVTPNLASMIA